MKRDEAVAWQMELLGSASVAGEVHTRGAMPAVGPCLTPCFCRHPAGPETLSRAEGHLQPGLASLHLPCKVAVSFSHPNDCVPSIRLIIALGLLGLRSALKALSGWLALLVKLALENHKYPNPALLCPADMFLMQFLCSSGQSCLSAPLGLG